MGGCRCTFRNCENSTASRPGMHFFHYPIRDVERLKKWVEIAEKLDFLNLEVDKLKNKVVCEEHFEERSFMNIKHERLIKSAVPSIVRSDGEMVEVSTEDISQYEMLTIEPVSNGNVIQTQNEPILLNNRKRSLVSNDYKSRPDNFVVDLNLEGLQNGDLTISFEETPVNTPSPSVPPPAKQKRSSFYPAGPEARKENRILNSSLNLNAKLSESVVLNNTSSLLEIPKKSPAVKPQMKVEKQSPIIPKLIPKFNTQSLIGSNNSNFNTSSSETAYQTLDLSMITDAIHSTVKSFNVLDKNLFEAKTTEQTHFVDDIKRMMAGIKSKQDELAKDFKTTQESLKQITTNQTVQINLLNSKQMQPVTPNIAIPPTKAESTTSSVKSKFNQNKIQLFNGIKKYLNPAMVALLRMELFGTNEREWKSDEKSISVELLNLGSSTYDYIRDEWRFRLPPKKDVEKWTNDNLDDDEENSDVN